MRLRKTETLCGALPMKSWIVKIIRKDSSAVEYNAYLSLCAVNGKGKEYDTVIFSTFFKEPTDIADIDGVEIDGVFYEF